MTVQKQVDEKFGELMSFDITELGSEGIARAQPTPKTHPKHQNNRK
jgi:hypothetical protein